MKMCGTCGETKELSSFARRGKGHQAKCKACNTDYQKAHYEANKDVYKQRRKVARDAIALWVREYKEAKGCMDCGGTFPFFVLDLDHRGDEQKVAAVSRMITDTGSLRLVKREVEKCDVVCANCHRVRTYERVLYAKNIEAAEVLELAA